MLVDFQRTFLSLVCTALLPSCAALATPSKVVAAPMDGIYPDEIRHPVPNDLSRFRQPADLRADLKRIQTGTMEQRLAALADKARRDLVFVPGGTFQMGDFGPLHSKEQLPWDSNSDSSPLHDVTLDSYSISKYKVTLAEFDLYADANKVPSVQMDEIYTNGLDGQPSYRSLLDRPAGTTWHQAKAYCQWLGKLTSQPFDLPTEAQWEYAARNRGKFVVYPTSNGKLEWNVNVPTHEMLKQVSNGDVMPIAIFPPNPLGLFDLAKNTMDWVEDWYAEDYYDRSANKNPKGPSSGTEKVQRGWPVTDSGAALTMHRRHKLPTPNGRYTTQNGFRCAVNSVSLVR